MPARVAQVRRVVVCVIVFVQRERVAGGALVGVGVPEPAARGVHVAGSEVVEAEGGAVFFASVAEPVCGGAGAGE